MSTRDIVLTALFAAIIVVLGLLPPIYLGFIPVPITAQSLGVMMAGVVLGAKRGAVSVLIVLLLATYLPVLSGGRGGLHVFVAPTSGFLYGWVFAAFVTGFLSEKLVHGEQSGLVQTISFFLAAMIGGIFVLYAFGIAYLAIAAGTTLKQAFVGSMAFIPIDVVKVFVAALVGRTVMVGYPLLPVRA